MKPKSVDEYIAQAPKGLQEKLKELRETIKSTAPEAEERISYGMPFYYYKGRLAYFNLWKDHIGLYALTSVLSDYKSELKDRVTGKGTVRLSLDEKPPLDLIKKLIKAQVKKNEE